MATILSELPETVTPSKADAELALVSSRETAKILSGKRKRKSIEDATVSSDAGQDYLRTCG